MGDLDSIGAAPDDGLQQTYGTAVRLLARREHSWHELRRKLHARGYPPAAVDAALSRLAQDGHQSDARFAESFVRSRVERGQGLLKIAAELQERGVAADVASAHLDLGDAQWCRLAATALRKRFGDGVPTSPAECSKRARFLAGRGFSRDIAARVLGVV